MQQLTIFDYESAEPTIKLIACSLFQYEIGKSGVGKIEATNHGSDALIIYKVTDACGELIVFAGLLNPHEVVWSDA